MELRLLPHSRSPSLGPNARLMGRANRQYHPIHLLRYISPRHLHYPLRHRTPTTLHHSLFRRYNLQRRRKYHIRRDDPSRRLDLPAR